MMIGTRFVAILGIRRHVRRVLVLRRPLLGAGGALHELPLVAEQHVEISIVPLRRVGRPRAFEPGGDRIATLAAAVGGEPAEAHRLDRRAFGLAAAVARGRRAVALAEGVAAGRQRDGLVVVHGHACEGFAHVAGGGERVRFAVRAFRVDVDEAHLHGGQRRRELTVAGVAAGGLVAGREPLHLGAPVDVLLGLPDVLAAAAEAERLAAHRLDGDVAREDHQIGPRELVAVLGLDRPQQAARLVEVAVVRPAVQGREALRAGAGAAAAVRGAVSAGAVPRHADEEAAVVAVVGGPPVLAIGHQRGEVALHRGEVELLELGGIVEGAAERITGGRVLMEHLEVQLVRPPVAVRPAAGRRVGGASPVHHRTFVVVSHVVTPSGYGSLRRVLYSRVVANAGHQVKLCDLMVSISAAYSLHGVGVIVDPQPSKSQMAIVPSLTPRRGARRPASCR